MDPQAYNMIVKVYKTINDSKGPLTDREMSYITGVLDALLAIFKGVEPEEEPRHKFNPFK